jgi:uncharacterized protein (TIGR03663 family)
MNRNSIVLLLLAVALALALRSPRLAERPMHNDEAVNAIKFGQLWDHGAYKYDPNEHHGPSLIYATYAFGRLTGAPDFVHYTENRLRWVTIVFGLGLVLLLPLVMDGLGRQEVAWVALFTAVSPAMVFYSRYFIHEMLLVFFTFLALAAGWRYRRSRRFGWMLLAGVALGLMAATKETFVITLGAATVAVALNGVWNRLLDASSPPLKSPRLNLWHVVAGAGAAALIWLLLLSSFFTNSAGPFDSVRTYLPWLHRAAGETPHSHPWFFYLQRLLCFHSAKGPFWSEGLILLLAGVATVAAFRRVNLGRADAAFVRFLTLYTFALTACYSLIAYKTPWCVLSFWHGAILLAGVGTAVFLRSLRAPSLRFAASLALLAGAGNLARQAWEQNTTYAADPRNPYAYAQTSPDLLRLVSRVESLAEASPQGRQTVIKVMAREGDYWPLPWYLRSFNQVGWWDSLQTDPFAPVMIVSADLQARLDEGKTHVMPGYWALRPQVLLELYVETNLWTHWLASQPPPKPE